MKNPTRRRLLVSAAALVGFGLSTSAEAATGTVAFKIVRGGFIVGVGGGSGALSFRGVRYPLSVGGVSLGATIGVSGTELVGTAFNLHDARDIEGTYTAAGAGLAVAGGAGVVELSNGRGVVLRLSGRQVGFKLSLAVSGLTVTPT
jgi:hypothetical protein